MLWKTAAAIVLTGGVLSPEMMLAGLVVEVVPAGINITVPPGYSGSLEVDLLNPATDAQSFSIEGFQFELRTPSGSGGLFSDATTGTSAASYIFAGNSFADSFFGGSLIVSPPPPPATNDLVAFDSVAAPGTFATLTPGETLGLGLVSYSVDPSAASATVPLSIISFDASTEPNGTQIVDPNGNLVAFSSSDGAITIQGLGSPVVPEPSTLTLLTISLTCGFGVRVGRRANCFRRRSEQLPDG